MMIRPWFITCVFGAALLALLLVWWEFPNIRSDDRGYTALGALLSALGFAGLLGTLILQHTALRKADTSHEEAMALQRDATRISAASSIVSALAASIEYIEPELRRARSLIDQARSASFAETHAAIAAIEEQLLDRGLNETVLRGNVQRILADVATFGLEQTDELKGALRREQELEQIKLEFLKQMSAAAAVCASEYEQQLLADITPADARAAEIHMLFESIYRLRPVS